MPTANPFTDTITFNVSMSDPNATQAWELTPDSFSSAVLTDGAEPNKVQGLLVEVDTSHVGYVNDNFKFYHPEDAEEAANTFLSPYGKPVLWDHDMWSPPLGRTVEAKFIPLRSKLSPTPLKNNTPQGVVRVKSRIGDYGAAEKILDGRYSTVSVRAVPENVYCSICNQDLMHPELRKEDEERCNHYPGKTYDKKLCYYIFRNWVYEEWSFVNRPADVFAGVTTTEGVQEDALKDANITQGLLRILEGATPVDKSRFILPFSATPGTPEKQIEVVDSHNGETQIMATIPAVETTDKATELQNTIDSLTQENTDLKAKLQLKQDTLATSAADQRKVLIDSYLICRTLNGYFGKDNAAIVTAWASTRERLASKNIDVLTTLVEEEFSKASEVYMAVDSTSTKDTAVEDAVDKPVVHGASDTTAKPKEPTVSVEDEGDETTVTKADKKDTSKDEEEGMSLTGFMASVGLDTRKMPQ